jgi:hypothetical protein
VQDVNVVSVPEQGQIVAVRQRRFVVTEVEKSTLPPPVLQGHQGLPQHLITLTSIEDDALGESLQVIWEVEPGAYIIEQEALPDPTGFDSPHRLDAFLNAVRWGAISSADTRALQAPFRSGIDLEDYQLDPLVRAVQMPRVNLLIADDVGLGKTIEAGMVTQELIVRTRARTVLIVCPAGLQIHWRDQMRDKFGLEFRIVDSQLMKMLRRSRGIHVNPWSHFPRLITSIDFLKRERPMRLFRETLPAEATYPRRFDQLIVDEAHNVAPSGRGYYAIDSLRTAAIRTLAPHFEHKLFLTATPHNGYQESFSALLELLDNQRFARGVMPNRTQLEAVMVRRLKSELTDWDGSPRFPQRRLDVIEVDYNEAERQVHQWLKEYTRLRLQNAGNETERFAAFLFAGGVCGHPEAARANHHPQQRRRRANPNWQTASALGGDFAPPDCPDGRRLRRRRRVRGGRDRRGGNSHAHGAALNAPRAQAIDRDAPLGRDSHGPTRLQNPRLCGLAAGSGETGRGVVG